MKQDHSQFFASDEIQDRRNRVGSIPPYLTDDGMVLIDRRKSINLFGPFAYRAWTEIDSSRLCPWNAWYQVYTLDGKTALSSPTRLDRQFVRPDDAFAAAAQMVKWEILHMMGNRDSQRLQ